MYLITDIEAVIDPTLPAYTPREGGDTFPPAPYWMPICIGTLAMDADLIPLGFRLFDGDEREILGAFAAAMDRKRPTVVGWNSRGYDVPVIDARCRRHGIQFAWAHSYDARYRYSEKASFDLKDYLANNGAARSWKLDVEARSMGLPGKMDVCGDDVVAMVATGRLAEVGAYCMSDVAQTAFVLLRVLLCRGSMPLERYRVAARALAEACTAHGGMAAEVVSRADMGRVLLEESVGVVAATEERA